MQQLAQISMFFANASITRHIPDEFWYESLEPQLEEQLTVFVKYKDQIDRKKFMSDFIKSCVSFGIRNIDSPLFKAKVESVVIGMVEELDAQTIENLIFYLQNAGEIRNGPLVKKIMQHIEAKEWVTQDKIHDIIILVNLLNEHRSIYQPESLWDQIEAMAILQCFEEQGRQSGVPEETLHEIMCLYAFEFSRSQNEFSEFYSRFLRFMGENEQILQQSLSLNGIANASIAYASLGLTSDDYASFWESVRTGAESSLLHDREPLESSKPIEMILGALTLVDGQEMMDQK